MMNADAHKKGHPRKRSAQRGDIALVHPDGTLPLNESVYQSIRGAIETGKFQPGQRLLEINLAKLLAVSRTPVRDAVRRLVSDGILTEVASRGVVVTQLDEEHVIELYSVLEVLEGTAAKFAAYKATAQDAMHLAGILEKEARSFGDVDQIISLNNDFHRTIYGAARNRYLTDSLRRLSDSLNLLRGSTLADPARQRSAHEEHVDIASAIRRGDAELAERIARQHIVEARRFRLQMLFGK